MNIKHLNANQYLATNQGVVSSNLASRARIRASQTIESERHVPQTAKCPKNMDQHPDSLLPKTFLKTREQERADNRHKWMTIAVGAVVMSPVVLLLHYLMSLISS